MLRSKSLGMSLSRRAGFGRSFLAGIASLWAPQAVQSHNLLVTQGEVVIDECQATVELEVAMEDFAHWYGVGADSSDEISLESLRGLVERHALALHRIFVIRDASGNALPSDPLATHLDWPGKNFIKMEDLQSLSATYRTQFRYPCAPRFLTFQLLMANDCPSIFWQTVLSVHGTEGGRGRTLRLTSRGNAETIELLWSDKPPRPQSNAGLERTCSIEGVDGLTQICAEINVDMESIDVRVVIPLMLLQTWFVLDGNDDEFLDAEEQRSASGKIKSLLADALSVESEGCKYAGEIVGIAFVPIDAEEADPLVENQRISQFTGRVSARLRYGPVAAIEQADFQWNLFNNAVFSVGATIGNDRSAVAHQFSTSRPRYRWSRGVTPPGVLPIP
jgi:hypothetical protein